MSERKGPFVAALTVASAVQLILAAGVASAQSADGSLEEIVVTAQRRDESAAKVPISISAFTSSAIETNQIQGVEDYVAKAPNLSISQGATRSGNVSTSSHGLSIRGISNVGGDSTSYGFYIDDFNVTRATINPQLVDIARIEVLRGPQGTFFGRNASAGVISLTTNKPNELFGGDVALEYARFDALEASGTINVPVSERFMLRASGKYAQGDGYAKNTNPVGGTNGYEYKYGRIAARFVPTDSLTIDLAATFNDEQQDDLGLISTGAYVPGAIGGFLCSVVSAQCPHDTASGIYPQNRRYYNHNNPLRVEDDYQIYTANVVWQGEGVTFTSVTGYAETDFHRAGELDMGSLDVVNEDFEDIQKSMVSQEFRLQSNGEGRFRWIVGGILARDKHDEIESINFGTDPTTLETFGVFPHFIIELSTLKREITSKALFAEGSWGVTDRLTLTAGARWSEDKIDRHETKIDFESLLAPQGASDSWDDISPKFAATFAVNNDTNLYATVAKGWKSGGINLELTTPTAPVNKFNEETLWNYEIGIKSMLLDRRLQANLAAFLIDWEDVQVNASRLIVDEDGALRSVTGVSNGAKARSQGLELGLTALPVPQLQLGLNVGYLDTEWKDFSGAVTGFGEIDLTGQPLPKAPELTLSADGQYTMKLGSEWEGFLRAEFNHQDKQYYDVNGTAGALLGARFPFQIPAHDVWNFRVGASNDRYRIVAYVENAFDDEYYTSTYDFGFTNGAGVVPSFRTYGVRFTANFGNH
jgi:iron complex outermembrane receptor protein